MIKLVLFAKTLLLIIVSEIVKWSRSKKIRVYLVEKYNKCFIDILK
jgi:hypothetical protein